MNQLVLVFNCGSSSIKFALFDAAKLSSSRTPVWGGQVQGIGQEKCTYSSSAGDTQALALGERNPYHEALAFIRERVAAHIGTDKLRVVAHRVVHGGSKYSAPTLIDTSTLVDLRSYIPLAPLHQPFAVDAIEVLLEAWPHLQQVACFDTAFHHTLPRVEQQFGLPHAYWERGLRRYGFHGLSYEYMSIALAERFAHLTPTPRTIVAHLGSGASLCAMQNWQSVATTTGFSALDGLMMGTRCGALDPGLVLYLLEIEKMSLAQLGHILYHESGLLGMSGLSADPRVLFAQDSGNERAADALNLFVRRVVHEIGAMTAKLGGLDLLVFTAGIGEHNAQVRQRICADLGFVGAVLDEGLNNQHAAVISAPQSKVIVGVEPTNEEWVAAKAASKIVA